jgi:D-glycerate 3-kinase
VAPRRGLPLAGWLRQEGLPPSYARLVRRLYAPLAGRIAGASRPTAGPLVVGLTGPQGSGKSTMAAVLARLLTSIGVRAEVLALDDLYLPLAERRRLAREVHPLLLTRGAPGTHDVALGLELLEALTQPGPTPIPRFDKATDDRADRGDWRLAHGPAEVVLFEGWCVGASPEPAVDLVQPINDLERDQDPHGVWRAYVNDALAGPYQALFQPLGFRVLLTAPDFGVVLGWRRRQEEKLRARLAATGKAGGLTDQELAVFVQHYERLTRHILANDPARADVVVRLGRDRRVLGTKGLD